MPELQSRSVPAMVAELRAGHLSNDKSGAHTLRLQLGDDYAALVESNSAALIELLADYFQEFTADGPAQPGDVRITALQADAPPVEELFPTPFTVGEQKPRGPKEAYLEVEGGRVVRKLRTGMLLMFGGDHHLAIGDCLKNNSQVVNFVNNRLIQWRLDHGCLLGHAAAVTSPSSNRALAIAAFSGGGKSTLSLKVMGRADGAVFVSNDRIMIGRAGPDGPVRVHGVPKHPRINPGTIVHNERLAWILTPEERAEYLAMDKEALWELERKYDGLIHRSFGPGRFALSATLTAVVLLNWRRDAGGGTTFTRIDPATRRDLLPGLIKSPGLFYQPPGGGRASSAPADEYVAMLRGVAVYEFAGAVDFAGAAARCARYLNGAGEIDGPG